jgi:hypothetical protein
MDKYITIQSTNSIDLYPDNKPWSFRVQLNEHLYFERQYTMALSDITISNWDADKRSDCRDVYIYSSICHPSHVGESKEPLLRRICLRGTKKERHFTFPQNYYIPIKVQDFQTLDVYIKESNGQTASFISGPVTVTLHLKPLPFWI